MHREHLSWFAGADWGADATQIGKDTSEPTSAPPSECASWLRDPHGRDDPCSWCCSLVLQIC